jgi:predicted AAA+ superfamily ATPase
MIDRIVYNTILEQLNKKKIIILFGPRQVGKTTLLKNLKDQKNNVLWLNADTSETQAIFETTSIIRFKSLFGPYKIVIIDEAQRILNIGLKLKILIDEMPELQVIATGSSAFELANEINEPLTGRKFENFLFPLSFEEMVNHHGLFNEINLLSHRIIYGYYPEVVTSFGNELEVIQAISDSYLYKDLLIWDKVKKSDKIVKLLQALSYQIGNQVSYHEIGNKIGLHSATVENYIQLLEKAFVIYRLPSFSRNIRSELTKTRKIYFYDNGVRNAIIGNFKPIELRNDVGELWENFVISERMKFKNYHKIYGNSYFWRTQKQQEIDFIEERDGKLFAFEIKWNTNAKTKFPKTFIENYQDSVLEVITPKNFESFVFMPEIY